MDFTGGPFFGTSALPPGRQSVPHASGAPDSLPSAMAEESHPPHITPITTSRTTKPEGLWPSRLYVVMHSGTVRRALQLGLLAHPHGDEFPYAAMLSPRRDAPVRHNGPFD